MKEWPGFSSFWIKIDGLILWTWSWTIVFHTGPELFWLSERLLASQQGPAVQCTQLGWTSGPDRRPVLWSAEFLLGQPLWNGIWNTSMKYCGPNDFIYRDTHSLRHPMGWLIKTRSLNFRNTCGSDLVVPLCKSKAIPVTGRGGLWGPANYKGCTVYKELQQKTYLPLRPKQYLLPSPLTRTLHTSPGVSYA
jgi:hypothetical protein